MTTDEFFTIKEVAKRFKVHPKTVALWLNRGEIKGVKIGNDWRIRQSDLEEFIRQGEPK